MCKCAIVTLLYLSAAFKINAELFTSVSKIELLIATQKNVIDNLHNIIKSKNIKNKIITNHLRRFQIEHKKAMKDIPKYIGNPINTFRLVKRLTVDLKLIETILNGIIDYKRNTSVIYPSQADLDGVTEGLLRLELVYKLNRTDLAAGLWNTSYGNSRTSFVEAFNPMTIGDCYELGKSYKKFKRYVIGIGWLMEAWKKYQHEWKSYPEDEEIRLEDIMSLTNNYYTTLEGEAAKYRNWLNEIALNGTDIKSIKKQVLFKCYKSGCKPSEEIKSIEEPVKHSAYPALCKGEIKDKEKVSKRFKCYLAHGPHPFLKLAPMKAERLHRAPILTLFHNIISDSEIEVLKAHALPRFKRGPIFPHNDSFFTYSRTCQGAEVMSNESDVAVRIKNRIEQFSGIQLTNSEELQVINYGLGGHCAPHHDYWDNITCRERSGERLATVLIYISDVEQGGATVFPVAGTAVFPKKGVALYWTNLLPSGQGDVRTFHAACPVLRGSKWTLTQWINLRGQELNRPCPLNSNPDP